ncbi:uncharacterized protein LOC124320652 [Daphnia pulicaria]|uniref:uncharacterized protein LOC124320652 n=1 Tax=Daphnia pulicaria TaxID=35523 RepID=UPI001EEBE619|nr:uncharacterized protein LOC124320652 [Daphnia pulicaria]
MPNLLCYYFDYFNQKDFIRTSYKSNALISGVFKWILVVIIVCICTRNQRISKMGKESPAPVMCSGNLLDQRDHHYAKEADGSYDNSRMISKLGSCHLMRYTFNQVVGCFNDVLNENNERYYLDRNPSNNLNFIKRPNKNLHFAFIGDSRIRQQFFNLLKLIPDYDRKSEPSPLPFVYHGDMEVTSDIMRLRLSFQWRPLINDSVIDTIRQWATYSQTDRPDLIILGIAMWHMFSTPKEDDHKVYREQLKRLAPFLDQLANVSKVIWLNQYPVVEKYGNIGAMNTEVFSEKIDHYNEAVRSELQNYPEMRILWDSSNSLVEEYIRGCVVFQQRLQLGVYLVTDPDYSYINCNDCRHPGYSALSQATQLLLNDLCNGQHLNFPLK